MKTKQNGDNFNYQSYQPNKSVHYKMYKSGKFWVTAGMTTFAFAVGVSGVRAYADDNVSATSVTNSSVATVSSSNESTNSSAISSLSPTSVPVSANFSTDSSAMTVKDSASSTESSTTSNSSSTNASSIADANLNSSASSSINSNLDSQSSNVSSVNNFDQLGSTVDSSVIKNTIVNSNGSLTAYDSNGSSTTLGSAISVSQISSSENNLPAGFANSNGVIVFYDQNGQLVKNNVITINGNRYGLDQNGQMVTGDWHYDGNRYYFLPDGVSLTNSFYDSNNQVSYFNENGVAITNQYKSTTDDPYKFYYFGSDGYDLTGAHVIDSCQVYFEPNGIQLKGGIGTDASGVQRYYDPNEGRAVTNQDIAVDDYIYHADNNGALTKVGINPASPNALMSNTVFNQNFHYNTPYGYANDVQTILPHVNSDGNVDYYDVYYLANLNPVQIAWADAWYHVRTTDFKTFTPIDPSDPTSVKNIAIPDPDYKDANGNSVQVADNNKDGIPWHYVATGSVIYNDGLLTKDQWGNAIDSDAKLAYFSTFTSSGQENYLAYSNNDEQFHPYQDKPVLSFAGDGRDMYVERTSDGLLGYIATGWSGHPLTFSSKDGVNWTNVDNNIDLGHELSTDTGSENETPIVKTISGQPYLFYSWHVGDYRGNAAINGTINQNGVFELTPDSKVVSVDGSPFKGDTYASNYTNLDADTLINLTWSGNWNYSPISNQYPFTRHGGSFALPRLVQSKDGQLQFVPVEPNNQLVTSYNITSDADKTPIIANTNNKLDITFNSLTGNREVDLNRSDSNLVITLTKDGLNVQRNNNTEQTLANAFQKDATMPLDTSKVSKMAVYVDNTSVEVYLPELNQTYNIVNPSSQQNEPYVMTVQGGAKVNVYDFGNDAPSLSVDEISNNVKSMADNINNDQKTWTGLAAVIKEHYADDNTISHDASLDGLSNASQSLSVANSYVDKATQSAGDSRASLYLTLASSAYAAASTAELQANQSIMNTRNQIATKAPTTVEDQDGNQVVNGHNVLFIDGNQVNGKIVTDNDGKSHYYDQENGYEVKNAFYVDNGSYYYFDQNGNMVKNQLVAAIPKTNYYYYFGQDGKAVTGTQTINGQQTLFDQNGIQVRNQLVLNTDGTLSYYQKNDGSLATGDVSVNGQSLHFDVNGQLTAANQLFKSPLNNDLYYLNANSQIVKGYQSIDNNTYYFGDDGKAETSSFIRDANGNVQSYVNQDGHTVKNQYVVLVPGGNDFYYFGSDGKAVTGPQIIDNTQRLFDSTGLQQKNKFYVNSDGTITYYNLSDGNPVQGNVNVNGQNLTFDNQEHLVANQQFVKAPDNDKVVYYLDNNKVVTGLRSINGQEYYFDANGQLFYGTKTINGIQYHTDDQGRLIQDVVPSSSATVIPESSASSSSATSSASSSNTANDDHVTSSNAITSSSAPTSPVISSHASSSSATTSSSAPTSSASVSHSSSSSTTTSSSAPTSSASSSHIHHRVRQPVAVHQRALQVVVM